MNTQPLFTLLDLSLNTPDLHTTHHSLGNTDDLLIQNTNLCITKQLWNGREKETREENDGELWETYKSWSQAGLCVRACVPASLHDSSYYIPGNHWDCLLYWVTTLRQQQFTKILCLGAACRRSLPSIECLCWLFHQFPFQSTELLRTGPGRGCGACLQVQSESMEPWNFFFFFK